MAASTYAQTEDTSKVLIGGPWRPHEDGYVMNDVEQTLAEDMAQPVNDMYHMIDEVKIVRARCSKEDHKGTGGFWRATLWVSIPNGFGIHTIHMMGIEGNGQSAIRWEMSGYVDNNEGYPTW
jgi:hypothetical protein